LIRSNRSTTGFSSYPDIANAYRTILGGFSDAEQLAMLSGNAERLFRI
jgi:predicted TIM-barrel fold metal-dependent hydrolase